jgi:hypothetical protein
MRGVIISCTDAAGRNHPALLDQPTRRIAILPSATNLPPLGGQLVEVVRSPDGTLSLRRRHLSQER